MVEAEMKQEAALRLVLQGTRNGLQVLWRLAKSILPSMVGMFVLRELNLLESLGVLCAPFMQLVGLPGEAGIPFVIGMAANIYAGIGAMAALSFLPAEITVLSIMISICHSVFIESSVVKESGASAVLIAMVRLVCAFLVAGFLHAVGFV